MKIAYLLSGFARGYRETAPLLEKNLLRLLRFAGHEVDIFISTWKLTDRGGYEEYHKDPIVELKKYYNDSNILIESNWSFNNRYLCDFYRRKEAWKYMLRAEEQKGCFYDIVFRDRMDTVHPKLFPLIELKLALENKDQIFFPEYIKDHEKDPFQDWTAFGHRDAMEKYYNVFDLIKDKTPEENIKSLIEETPRLYDPEYVLYAGLKSQKIGWRKSLYEITPYDRHFGNKIHEINIHSDAKNLKFRIPTTVYENSKIPNVEERRNERTYSRN